MDDWWASTARAAILTQALTGEDFGADDVRTLGVPEPDHPNRWGGAFAAAYREGIIEPVGERASTIESRHGGAIKQWVGTPYARALDAQARQARQRVRAAIAATSD